MGLAQRILSLLSLSLTFSLFALRLGCPGLVGGAEYLGSSETLTQASAASGRGWISSQHSGAYIIIKFWVFSAIFCSNQLFFNLFSLFFSWIIVTSCPCCWFCWAMERSWGWSQFPVYNSHLSSFSPHSSGLRVPSAPPDSAQSEIMGCPCVKS